jgi:hypothetical protein
MKKTSLKVYGEAGISPAAMRVVRDGTERLEPVRGDARLSVAVTCVEGAVINRRLYLLAQSAQPANVSLVSLHKKSNDELKRRAFKLEQAFHSSFCILASAFLL